MPCYAPIQGWRAAEWNKNGKRPIVFRHMEGCRDLPVLIPCGTCLGCRLEFARQWSIRCLHESKLYRDNVFVTLTYDERHLPDGGTLVPDDFTNFLRRVRYKYPGVRYFMSGEYGDRTNRPHYHALLFNCWFGDRMFYSGQGDSRLYTSKECDALWGLGACKLGDVTAQSAGYVARYAMKKAIIGNKAVEYYGGRVPEYLRMSRRPGIGKLWFDKYRSEIYRNDSCIVDGREVKPPKYYDGLMDKSKAIRVVKSKRVRAARENRADNSGKRLADKFVVKSASVNFLARNGV